MADIKLRYGTALVPTVTALQSLASSSSFTSGWTSAWIDNETTLALDYLVSAAFELGTGPTAGEIRVYAYADHPNGDDPDLFVSGAEGSQGVVTVHDTEMLSGFVLLWSTDTDTTTNDPHEMPPRSIKAAFGQVPRKFALYVSHSTVAALRSTGQAVYADPSWEQSI